MGTVRNIGTKENPKWYMRYMEGGRRRECLTHQPTKALAEACLRETESRIARGVLGVPERPTEEQIRRKTITFGDLAAIFCEKYERAKIKNIEAYRLQAQGAARRLAPFIGQRVAAEVRRDELERAGQEMLKMGYRPDTVRSTFAFASRLYLWAVDKEILDCPKIPTRGLEYPEKQPSEEFFSRGQVYRLLSIGRPMLTAALYTGLRKGELFGLRWVDVDFAKGVINVRRSYRGTPKSGKSRIVPLHRELVPMLQEWRRRCPQTAEGVVFPVLAIESGGTRAGCGWCMGQRHDMEGIGDLLRGLGWHIPQKPWHSLRHTFATLFIEAGGAYVALEKILGHAATSNLITVGYTHVGLDFLAREMSKLSLRPPADWIPDAVEDPPDEPLPVDPGVLLTTSEAARRLGISPKALRLRASTDPLLRRLAKQSTTKKGPHGGILLWPWPLPTPAGPQRRGSLAAHQAQRLLPPPCREERPERLLSAPSLPPPNESLDPEH